MKSSRWLRRITWVLVFTLLLTGLGFVAEQIDRGIIMRPVRKLAAKANINIQPPKLTAEEEAEAQQMAETWKQECLQKYPVLNVTPHPVPEEQNGYWMLWRLDQREPLSEEFKTLLRNLDDYDPVVAKKCLEEHADYVAHIEKIADTPSRSSMDLPEEYNGFLGARDSKLAYETLMLKASLAAREKNEAEALRCMRQVNKLIEHLRGIETPFLLSETVVILGDLQRMKIIVSNILPALGPSCDLEAWHQEMKSAGEYSPQRFAELLRGEWQTGTRHMVIPMLSQADMSGEIADGKACVMAYAEWIAHTFTEIQSAKSWEDVEINATEETFAHLPAEPRELMSVLCIGASSWGNGFARAAVVTAQHQAAMDLLMIEKAQGAITVADTAKITLDPASNPFIFDPELRTLSATQRSDQHKIDPLKLPW